MGDPSIPPPLLLTKMLSLGAVAMIFMERELLQAITTPFSHHLPENGIFGQKCKLEGGGWRTVWSQTPPITLNLGRCAQGHN